MSNNKAPDIIKTGFKLPEKVCILGPGSNGIPHWEKIENMFIIAVNCAVNIPVSANIWLLADGNAPKAKWFPEGIKNHHGLRVFSYAVTNRCNEKSDYGFYMMQPPDNNFVRNPKMFRPGETTVGIAIDFANRFGAKEIVLCGVDQCGPIYFDGNMARNYPPLMTHAGCHRITKIIKMVEGYGSKVWSISPTRLPECENEYGIIDPYDTKVEWEKRLIEKWTTCSEKEDITKSDFKFPEFVTILAPGPNGRTHWNKMSDYVIAVNKAIQIPVDIKCWIVGDGNAAKMDWFKWGCKNFHGIKIFSEAVHERTDFRGDYTFWMVPEFEEGYRKYPGHFRPDESTTGIALDMACRYGAKKIGLCGVDMFGETYFDGEEATCSDEYTRGENWSQKKALDEMILWHREKGWNIHSLSKTALEITDSYTF